MGRGAFKDVYKGFDLFGNAEIAWNQICFDDEKALNSPENQDRLYSEANLLQSLSHSNIMKCYTSWLDYDNKTVNMITELFSSGSLRQYIKKLGGVDLQTIKIWGRQILQGLNYLHTRSPCVIHRDLKCDNIFVDITSGEIKIGDFGLAIEMERAPVRVLAGTPEFMAPEYYDEEYDELVDVYAFGMCLMELATLEYPYCECTNPAQIFKKVTTGVKPSTLAKVKDSEVKEIIEKCLLPASMRPSALELLKDPFFSSGKNSMEIEMNIVEDQSPRMQSWCTDESILSGISMLYNSMSLSDGGYIGKLPRSCCYRSSMGDDVSMNSRITFASSSGDVSKDFALSKLLSGKSHAN
ncbi:probable serine/threonine-protein kinase wnk6 [Phtheirospermum japonicum]|uniref:non-specific serine/threonine protein kinase n=1 Tax=Phtheirospermum japonicum TaxID=374723 RepID=A0A830DDM2_9LAMI|nr:probable serine/threonine-protein kinase wnk6 [Phtheirospermum japonicum]